MRMESKEVAYILFREGVPGQDIAKILGRSEQTVSRWKKEGEWDRKMADDVTAMQTIHDDTRELVIYQLATLRKLKEKYVEAERNGAEPKLISKGDIDGARDLYNMIREKEADFTTVVRIIRKVNAFFKANYPALAKDAVGPLNEFLQEERGGLQ